DGPNVGVDHELTLSVPKDLAKSGAELIRSGKGPHSGAPEWETFRKGLFWKATIDAVTDPFRATAELDDGRIAWKRFQVLPRPVVRTIKLTVTPPDYTPLSPEIHDKTGDVAAIQGSIVKVELQATQKLLHAQLQFSDGEPGQAANAGQPQVVKLKAADTTQADTVWTGTFEVTRNTSYFIDLRATNGLTHPNNPPVYQVVCKIDSLPTVLVKFPKADDTVTLKAKYPIQFSAHDNFGIKAIRLRYKVGEEETDKITTIDILTPAKDGHDRALKPDIDGSMPLEIGSLVDNNGRVVEGEVITFWLEAQDAATTERPVGMTPGLAESAYTKNWARSNLYRLAIVTPQEKETELRQKVQEQLDLIQQQAETIKKDRNEKVVPAIENKTAP
ncbi:MAG TPA: hypothetical protein VL860_07720, partial [Planctomycetota bacterium]|nr:hypothetical protein [Planctomycetota bacterium]